jgi:hypothetical protein
MAMMAFKAINMTVINHFFTTHLHGFSTIRVDLHVAFSAGYFGSF